MLSQRSHDRKECEPENAGFGRRAFRLAEKQRGLESTSLHRHELRQSWFQNGRDQIAERRERDLRLRVGRACLQNSDAALSCVAQPLLPESRLADPCVALQQQRLTARGDIRQKRSEREQLFAPADDLNCHATFRPVRRLCTLSRTPTRRSRR